MTEALGTIRTWLQTRQLRSHSSPLTQLPDQFTLPLSPAIVYCKEQVTKPFYRGSSQQPCLHSAATSIS
ncbi:MAG TPA: hypothetical protein VK211_25985 [Kamptonema sp.]|nr:hypothetical protein [Kamptonema sp.]